MLTTSKLRSLREFELLKSALFAGGLTPDTLALLIADGSDAHAQPDRVDGWANEYKDRPAAYRDGLKIPNVEVTSPNAMRNPQSYGRLTSIQDGGPRPYTLRQYPSQVQSQISRDFGRSSNGFTCSSVPEQSTFDAAESDVEDDNAEIHPVSRPNDGARRTLYFIGFNSGTSYRDLLSVIKGGSILSINVRPEKSATVSFLDGAADYLAWAKRNDVYINGRRVEVRWADRQFVLHAHVANKIADGATRNILIRKALEKDLTEEQIRDDMEHIHGLVIIDITYRDGDAYISTNSVHNALFARTCMMSRRDYRGCKIEFYPDECDVALPIRPHPNRLDDRKPVMQKMDVSFVNKFDMLQSEDVDGSELNSENEDTCATLSNESDDGERYHGFDDDDDAGSNIINIPSRHGVRLSYPEDESDF